MRIVLDTNVVLSALLFQQGRLTWLRELWTGGTITPLIDKPCAEELLRVVAYPKFQLGADEIEALLGTYLPDTETVETARGKAGHFPRCRDPHDQKFLVLAQVGQADALITGDQALLTLSGKTRFMIQKPSDLHAQSVGTKR